MTGFPSAPIVALAPMAGFTDSIFRVLCLRQGADLLYSEMISAKGIRYLSADTDALLRVSAGESGIRIQLFGHEPDTVADAARYVLDRLGPLCGGIDLNMGCPAPKIFNNGDGSALLGDLPLAGKIVEAVATAVPVPVSVKFRAGITPDRIVAVPFARAMEQSGAALLAFHARTRVQMYAGKADRMLARAVRESVSIPVLYNGDVSSGPDSLSALAVTGCAGVMVGRAALGNQFLFREIRASLRGETAVPATPEERFRQAAEHAEAAFSAYGTHGIVALRKHLCFYATGIPGAVSLRVRLQQANTPDDVRSILGFDRANA